MKKSIFIVNSCGYSRQAILAILLLILISTGCARLNRRLSANPPAQTTASPESIVDSETDNSNPSLKPEQKKQIRQIRRSTLSQIDAILTPEQQTQFHSQLQKTNGGKASLKTALASLGLSPEQETQIKTILKTSKAQIKSIKHGAEVKSE
jgi:Spy/CpxP family protein refolding chaperone